jgi:nicotinate-nucleotide pyrophosphorylase (carboxylating)
VALAEDEASRDATSALLPRDWTIPACVIAKEPCVLAGLDAVAAFGGRVAVRRRRRDGMRVASGDVIASLVGPARDILSAERVVLNLMARMSGIATLTLAYVERLAKGSRTRILDTRKTTPGLREIEKYAVLCGGGFNHRMNLAESIFIKDNHLAARSLDSLMREARRRGSRTEIIVEADTPERVREVLAHRPDRILLDNMTDDDVRDATRLIRATRGRIAIEVSGGITIGRIARLSRMNVDYISVGALTHAARAVDLSLEVEGG